MQLPEKEIIDKYINQGIKIKDLADHYNCTSKDITSILEKNNVAIQGKKTKPIYAINDKIGDWTVIGYIKKEDREYIICKCQCGNISHIRQRNLNRGKSIRCKKCSNIKNKEINLIDIDILMTNSIYNAYIKRSELKKLEFTLDVPKFSELIHGSCYYCGALPMNMFARKRCGIDQVSYYNGIDRIDNNKGYVESNCVSCCPICNYAKSTLLKDQFLEWVKKIYTHQFKRLSEKTPGILADELFTINMKLWYEQEKIMNSPESSEEALNAAKMAQELNAKRNRAIRALDQLFDFQESTLTHKTYGES